MSESFPQPRFGRFVTPSGLPAAVAILACLAMTHEMIHVTSEPVYVTVSAIVGAFFALGAMRKPWFFLAVTGVVWATFPRVSDSSADSMLGGTYSLGAISGALAGWIIRGHRVRRRTHAKLPNESAT